VLDYSRLGEPFEQTALITVFISALTDEYQSTRMFTLIEKDYVYLPDLINEVKAIAQRHEFGFINRLEHDGYAYIDGTFLRYISAGKP
jgi:hypothetical protein